ncbi:hypothetical protein [Reyranella sp.]|uniref:hypothetical protein n=1 Tax=Reyranella sp. TaxID=1929291 RepID=UPI00272FBE01|nr:hypothetical protein [Reyranella sp.]MDP2377770.1 hypothetical protein [Reyranella sp.]
MTDSPTRAEPMVPYDADLRGMEYMPLKGEQLFNSVFWVDSSPEARCAGLRLWWHAFAKEVPAGTLPDNDRLLAVYAGYGDKVRPWRKVKEQAMRGWFLASDDRLHHKTVAEVVVDAWEQRLEHRDLAEAKTERLRRWRGDLKKLASRLRDKGIAVPRGASRETLERLCRDAGIAVSVDA